MRVMRPFTCRGVRSRKRWAIVTLVTMLVSPLGGPAFVPTVKAQSAAPVSQGFVITAGDLRFIFSQILVAQDHAAGGALLGPGPNQVHDPQLPRGLRTVDGTFNNLVPGQVDANGVQSQFFGAADQLFPRRTTPVFRAAEAGTSYTQLAGNVFDSQPRMISNLIVDQTRHNPAAVAANVNPCGSGQFVCGGGGVVAGPGLDGVFGTTPTDPAGADDVLFIPNITPDFGLSAPFNLMFTFFGQFFDHGLDLVNKGGNGSVIMPLRPDDPLFVAGGPNIMVMTRATVDANHNAVNQTTPWVDQNQTYTSHPSHQVFLREYEMRIVAGQSRPFQTGKVLDGALSTCAPRGTGIAGDNICNIGNWTEVKAQASTKLGIRLIDTDVFDVPLLLTDPYGHFIPGPLRGMPQVVFPAGPGSVACVPALAGGFQCREGNPATPVSVAGSAKTNHQFLNDIAHSAVPVGPTGAPLAPDPDTVAGTSLSTPPAGTYDDELLGLHFVTGDGRGNENIALTMVHNIFHAEHNRLRFDIDRLINTPGFLTAAEVTAWKSVHPGSGWDYAERLFQAARFVTEMEYQHLVFEEFARTIQPLINPFLGGITDINPAIVAEFAHTVYRLGHSMLPEVVARINVNAAGVETPADIRLLNAFLNPQAYNTSCTVATPTVPSVCSTLTADKAAGTIVRGLSRQVGNELDEFVTDSVRNQLVGLPLDLPAINIARGRSEGIPPLNVARRQFFTATRDAAVAPYANWFEFGLNLKHQESLINFVAAYGTEPTITAATTLAGKRAAAAALVGPPMAPFMFLDAATSGLDNVDYWVGGLAERQAVFGGLLGSTFNFVFEKQLEDLQNGDRFYYLQRLDGTNLVQQLEGNSFAELIRRNTDFQGGMDVVFNTADNIISAADLANPLFNPGDGTSILTLPDGTKVFNDPLHRGKNIVFNGGPGADKFRADVGDDTLYGNDGNDRLDGWEGNDTLHGGNGDDILFGGNGDDVLKGGDGNDALSSGPGFGADLEIGGNGNDFLLGGDDGVEYFGGPGNDIIVDGSQRSEGTFGGEGDDWLDNGDGHDGGMFGDGGNVFDLLAGLDFVGGDDVMNGGPGQDNHFGEGGDDIMLMSEGTNKFFGDFGFDWITLRAWPLPEFIELDLLANPNVNLNFNDLRSRYRFVDGASGWNLNDHIAGSNNVLCNPPGEVAECLIPGMELTVAGAAKITGLTELMGPTGFNKSLTDPAIPGIKGVGFMGGDILLGGLGSDVLEGKLGDDLIDGDVWLNVQLEARLNNGTVKLVNSPRELVDDVFADPQRLNPGNIRIVRTIVTPTAAQVGPADCGTVAPRNCDTAVFAFPFADYTITINPNGTLTVTHVPRLKKDIPFSDGSDTLRNIERLQFTNVDGTPAFVPVEALAAGLVTVPNVVGFTQAAATDAIVLAGLTVGLVSFVDGPTARGTVINQTPLGGARTTLGAAVALTVSNGPAAALAATLVTHTAAPALQIVSPNITPGPNTLLVAIVSANNPLTNVATVRNLPMSGTQLTWTRASRSVFQPGTTGEVWWAFTSPAHATMQVQAFGAFTNPATLTVMAFTATAGSLVGAVSATASATSGPPAATLITSRDNSMVIGVGTDFAGVQTMTPAAGQSIVYQANPSGGTYWVQQVGSAGVAGTSVTISDTYGPTMSDPWNLILFEIRRP